jgi:hypothetical protein
LIKVDRPLATLLRSYKYTLDPEVVKSLNILESCFGKFAAFNEGAVEEGPDLPDLGEDHGNQALTDSCLEQLAGLLDCLFEVLPSIDRMRQTWILSLEKRSKELAASLAAATALSERNCAHP